MPKTKYEKLHKKVAKILGLTKKRPMRINAFEMASNGAAWSQIVVELEQPFGVKHTVRLYSSEEAETVRWYNLLAEFANLRLPETAWRQGTYDAKSQKPL